MYVLVVRDSKGVCNIGVVHRRVRRIHRHLNFEIGTLAAKGDVAAPVSEDVERTEYPVAVHDVGIHHVDDVGRGVCVSRRNRADAVLSLYEVLSRDGPGVDVGVH